MTDHLFIYPLALRDYMLPCLSKRMFGFDCPGCGLQRSIVLILEGEFWAAFKMYPAIYTLIALGAVIAFNKFFGAKYINQATIALSISSVTLILINFIIKLILH